MGEKSRFEFAYTYPMSEAEFEENNDREIGWYMAMVRRKRWQRITLGRPLEDDDELRERKLRYCTVELIPLWAAAISAASGEEKYSYGYSYINQRLELPDEEWQEVVNRALEGGIDYMLDNFFEGVPASAILGR